jgi:predicted AAA+ superfamily ATPase
MLLTFNITGDKIMTVTDYYKFLFKNVLRPFQREILTSALNNTKVGVLGSRQIGKTYAISFLALILGLGTKKILDIMFC